MIERLPEESNGGPGLPRKSYALTELGRRVLEAETVRLHGHGKGGTPATERGGDVRSGLQFLHDCYHLLLTLYPQGYREEYGEELQTVFDLSMEDVIKLGRLAAAKVFLLEVIHLPGAILLEHLRERRKNKMVRKTDRLLNFPPGSRHETLVALAPFLVLAGLPILFGMLSSQLDTPIWERSGRLLAVDKDALNV